MIGSTYSVIETAGELWVLWRAPKIPTAFLALGAALALAGALVFIDRRRIRHRFASRFPALSGERFLFWLGPGLLTLSLWVCLLAAPKPPLMRWEIASESLLIKSPSGDLRLPWREVHSAYLDPREKKPEDASLVLESGGGKKTWLVLKWLKKYQRYRVVKALGHRLPGPMDRILKNDSYLDKLRW